MSTPNMARLQMLANIHLLLGTAPNAKLQRMYNKIAAMTDATCRERWAIRVLSDHLGLYGTTEQHILHEVCAGVSADNTHVVYANAGMTGDELRYALTQGDYVGSYYKHHTGLKSTKVKENDPIAEPRIGLEGVQTELELG